MVVCRVLHRRRWRGLVLLLLAVLGLSLLLHQSLLSSWSAQLPRLLRLGPDEVEVELRRRQELYQDVCVARGSDVVTNNTLLLQHKNLSFSVCHAPKVGCTFWSRVFLFLLQGQKSNVSSPFLIDRHTVHYKNPEPLAKLQEKEARELAAASTRVMFTRDPYARLWSAYVDKFVLPDFWQSHGKFINQMLTGRKEVTCPMNVTFPEFLRYALQRQDTHWMPVSQRCQPCVFLPQVVGRMETFTRDAEFLLQTLGLPPFLHNFDHAESEIRLLTRDFVTLVLRQKARTCLTLDMVSRRLWDVFQMNGHLDPDLPFPARAVTRLLQASQPGKAGSEALQQGMVDIMLEGRSRGRKSPEELRRHKHDVMARAYSEVSAELLRGIQLQFLDDFLMFGYDPWPDFIYAGRVDVQQTNSTSLEASAKPPPRDGQADRAPAKDSPQKTPGKTSTATKDSSKTSSSKQAPVLSEGKASQQNASAVEKPAQAAAP